MEFPAEECPVGLRNPCSPPLLYDERTGEPYLPLLPPLGPRIRLTMPRFDLINPDLEPNDVGPVVHFHNLPEIYPFLLNPPRPFLPEHAVQWLTRRKTGCLAILDEMRNGQAGSPVDGCPVHILREVKDDGTDVFIGDVSFARSHFPEVADSVERARRKKENDAYPSGDPRVVYTFAFYLSPAYRGQGIMVTAVRTVLEMWAIPVTRARSFQASAMSHNIGSQKVFLKNGFHFTEELENVVDLRKLNKGDGYVNCKVYERSITEE